MLLDQLGCSLDVLDDVTVGMLHVHHDRSTLGAEPPSEPELDGSAIHGRLVTVTRPNSLRAAHRRGPSDPSRRAVALVMHGWRLSSSLLRVGDAGDRPSRGGDSAALKPFRRKNAPAQRTNRSETTSMVTA
jgi:hypothetical protein